MRLKIVVIVFFALFSAVTARLYFWQVVTAVTSCHEYPVAASGNHIGTTEKAVTCTSRVSSGRVAQETGYEEAMRVREATAAAKPVTLPR